MPYRYVLCIASFPGYKHRIDRIVSNVSTYRVAERIDWRERVEAWLSNFEGLNDQRIAMGCGSFGALPESSTLTLAPTTLEKRLRPEDYGASAPVE